MRLYGRAQTSIDVQPSQRSRTVHALVSMSAKKVSFSEEEVTDTGNLRVASLRAMIPPSCVYEDHPGDLTVYSQVIDSRQAINSMLAGSDDRLLVTIGLSRQSHDKAALSQLADELASLTADFRGELLIILQADAAMSPDPSTEEEAYNFNRAVRQSRELMLELNRLGLPTAVEFRDTITPQFFADLLSWASVSGRTESLMELVSGLSMPVGLTVPASDAAGVLKAIDVTGGANHFLGVSAEGVCGVVQSTGNPDVIAVFEAGTGGEGAAKALASVHKERPSTSLMIALPPPALTSAAMDASIATFTAQLTGGGSLATRVLGLQLQLPPQATTRLTLQPLLSKLAAAVKERRRTSTLRRASAAAEGTETDNLHISDVRPLLPPAILLEELQRDAMQASIVAKSRRELAAVLSNRSDRLAVFAGPAVVDSPKAAIEYGARLASLAREVTPSRRQAAAKPPPSRRLHACDHHHHHHHHHHPCAWQVSDDIVLVMRTELFTEVSPSAGPWPGLLFDPNKDGSYLINSGIRQSRELLLELGRLGVPTAVEFRETITPQFFADVLTWATVSAQSETLVELVSGLSMPAGLRAPTEAESGTEDAASARTSVSAAKQAQHFLGVTAHGLAGVVEAIGNDDCAMVLGGGRGTGAERAARVLEACALDKDTAVVAECHSGGAVDSEQTTMAADIAAAIAAAKAAPRAVILGSYLLAGAQRSGGQPIHGLSVTDPCEPTRPSPTESPARVPCPRVACPSCLPGCLPSVAARRLWLLALPPFCAAWAHRALLSRSS